MTQGVFGSLFAAGAARGRRLRPGLAAGFVAGLAADLDVLIRSGQDPLLTVEYHRHFTHSLIFVPAGALVVALCLWPLMRRRLTFGWLYLFCFLGYLSHGLLDAFTSYGTQLLWPFSNMRVAWNWISVIDPLFTVPLMVLLGLAVWRRHAGLSLIAGAWAALYLGFGGWQNQRAEQALLAYAHERGHRIQRLVAKPGFANLILWRGLYQAGDEFHVAAIRVPPLRGAAVIHPGPSVPRFELAPWAETTVLGRDLRRFEHFSAGWIVQYPADTAAGGVFVGDLRYAIDPASARPLWGVRFEPDAGEHRMTFERLTRVDAGEREAFFLRLKGLPPDSIERP